MHESASRNRGSSRIAVRPLSMRTMCSSFGPCTPIWSVSSMSADRDGPVMNCVYVLNFCPVALRARSFSTATASSSEGTIFSMPTSAMCTGGTLVARSAFPSFVTRTSVPVSAISTLPPVMPMSAFRKLSRSWVRAIATSAAGSLSTGWPTTFENSSATSSRVLWIAGELEDPLAEVRLDRRDALGDEVLVEVDLLGRHRLRLHDELRLLRAAEPGDDPARLLRVGGAVDLRAHRLRLLGEALHERGQVIDRGPLALREVGAQALPVDLVHSGLALLAERGERAPEGEREPWRVQRSLELALEVLLRGGHAAGAPARNRNAGPSRTGATSVVTATIISTAPYSGASMMPAARPSDATTRPTSPRGTIPTPTRTAAARLVPYIASPQPMSFVTMARIVIATPSASADGSRRAAKSKRAPVMTKKNGTRKARIGSRSRFSSSSSESSATSSPAMKAPTIAASPMIPARAPSPRQRTSAADSAP